MKQLRGFSIRLRGFLETPEIPESVNYLICCDFDAIQVIVTTNPRNSFNPEFVAFLDSSIPVVFVPWGCDEYLIVHC